MAAHVVTAMGQVEEDIKQDRINWSVLMAALMLSSWTEELDLDDYAALLVIAENEDEDRLQEWIDRVKPRYQKRWEKLDRPRTREEWWKAVKEFGYV